MWSAHHTEAQKLSSFFCFVLKTYFWNISFYLIFWWSAEELYLYQPYWRTVILSLLCFLPWHILPLKMRVLLCRHLKNQPTLSALNKFFVSYSVSTRDNIWTQINPQICIHLPLSWMICCCVSWIHQAIHCWPLKLLILISEVSFAILLEILLFKCLL